MKNDIFPQVGFITSALDQINILGISADSHKRELMKAFSDLYKIVRTLPSNNEGNLRNFIAQLKAEHKNLIEFLIKSSPERLKKKFVNFSAGGIGEAEIPSQAESSLGDEKKISVDNNSSVKIDSPPVDSKLLEGKTLLSESKILSLYSKKLIEDFSQSLCPSGHIYKNLFSELEKTLNKTIINRNDEQVRVTDSLSRLLSLEDNKCCAVSILPSDYLTEESQLKRGAMRYENKLIVAYNTPHKESKLKSLELVKLICNKKLEIISNFIKTCKGIETKWQAVKGKDQELYKKFISLAKLEAAVKSVRELLKYGGCGPLGANLDENSKIRRLVLDLLKVQSRLPFPSIAEILVGEIDSTHHLAKHAEQIIMEYYMKIRDQLKKDLPIIIGCQKLNCLDCAETHIFFEKTALKFKMRGYSSLAYPNVYCLVPESFCNKCGTLFKQGSQLLHSMINPCPELPETLLYDEDSDSDCENLDVVVPKIIPKFG
jgi:hypothetical protein